MLKNKAARTSCPGGPYNYIGNSILAVVLLHDLDEVDNLVRVTNLVVIPRNNLNELVCQVNACVSVEDRCQRASEEVRRNDLVLSIAEHTLQFTLRSFPSLRCRCLPWLQGSSGLQSGQLQIRPK